MKKKWSLKPVEVWWRDSTTLKTYWQDFEDGINVARDANLSQRSVGMLVEKNKDRVIISQSISIDGKNVFGQMGGFLVIPREAIIEIRKLKTK
jgi:hypothetical protein